MACRVWDARPDGGPPDPHGRRAGRRGGGGRPAPRRRSAAEDVTLRGGTWSRARPATAARHAPPIADVEHSLVVVNGLLHRGETTPGCSAATTSMSHRGRTRLHTRPRRRLADARSSPWARRAPLPVLAQRLPAPEPQYEIQDRSGGSSRASTSRGRSSGSSSSSTASEKYLEVPPTRRDGGRRGAAREAARGADLRADRVALHPDHLGRPRRPGPDRRPDPCASGRRASGRPDSTLRLSVHFRRCQGVATPDKCRDPRSTGDRPPTPTSPGGSRTAWRARWWCG